MENVCSFTSFIFANGSRQHKETQSLISLILFVQTDLDEFKKKNKDDDEKDVDTSETKGQEEKPSKKEKSAKKKILSMTTKKLNSLNLSLKKQ